MRATLFGVAAVSLLTVSAAFGADLAVPPVAARPRRRLSPGRVATPAATSAAALGKRISTITPAFCPPTRDLRPPISTSALHARRPDRLRLSIRVQLGSRH